ncbi:MAG: hypothetical protein P4M12_07990 [Gammaproteobacteria bacterium]|nr:hypothetical protein [Gammaproteobacteria bacterium]
MKSQSNDYLSTKALESYYHSEIQLKKYLQDSKENNDMHIFAILELLKKGRSDIVQAELIDNLAREKKSYSSRLIPIEEGEHTKPQSRAELASEYQERLFSKLFDKQKKALQFSPLSDEDKSNLDDVKKRQKWDEQLKVFEDAHLYLEIKMNQALSITRGRLASNLEKNDQNLALGSGFANMKDAIRASFSNRDIMLPDQLARLKLLEQQVYTNHLLSTAMNTARPSIEREFFLSTPESKAALSAATASNESIKDTQERLAKELGLRTLDNKNYPLSSKEYDERVQLIERLTNAVNNMSNSSVKNELQLANAVLKEQLGSKIDRYAALLNRNNYTHDQKLIDQIQKDLRTEISGDKTLSDMESVSINTVIDLMQSRLNQTAIHLDKELDKIHSEQSSHFTRRPRSALERDKKNCSSTLESVKKSLEEGNDIMKQAETKTQQIRPTL